MIKEITGCKNCPFNAKDFDSWEEPYNSCNLIITEIIENKETLFFKKYFIPFRREGIVKSKNKLTLDNCPLLKEQLTITLIQK